MLSYVLSVFLYPLLFYAFANDMRNDVFRSSNSAVVRHSIISLLTRVSRDRILNEWEDASGDSEDDKNDEDDELPCVIGESEGVRSIDKVQLTEKID